MAEPEESPVVSCDVQGGTLSVYDDRVVIERSGASMFGDKTIPFDEVLGVEYAPGIVTGHLQIGQVGVDAAEGGFLTHPVDENTLFFPRSGRTCAERARDAILERASGPPADA